MRYNGNKFSVYESEEKTVLGLLGELGSQVNHNTEDLEKVIESDNKKVSHDEMNTIYKIDKNADFTGSWHGIKKPTESQEGLQATVDKIVEEDIPSINEQLDTKANLNDVIKKGYANLNDFDETTRLLLQGQEQGKINAVLGKGNVKLDNTDFSIILSKNILNNNAITLNKGLNEVGGIVDSQNLCLSDFQIVEPNTLYSEYYVNDDGTISPNREYTAFYDEYQNLISVTNKEPWYQYTTPSNCRLIRSNSSLNKYKKAMIVKGEINVNQTDAVFIPYDIKIDTEAINYDFKKVDEFIESSKTNELPSYWKGYLNDKIYRIKQLLSKPDTHYTPLIFVSDTHYATSNNVDNLIINYLNENLPIAQVLHGGDFITTEATHLDCYEKLNMCVKKYDKVKDKLLIALGNHDCVSSGSTPYPFLKSQADEVLLSNLSLINNISKPKLADYNQIKYDVMGNFGYYYKDDENKKIRYIVLNSCDNFRNEEGQDIGFAFKDEQVEWFLSEALNLSNKGSGWRVLVLSHLYTNSNIKGSESEPVTYNIEHIQGALNSFISKEKYTFKNKDYDFTQNTNKFVGYFCGHYHYDTIIKDGNINVIATLNADGHVYTPSDCTPIERTAGTTNETALNVLLIGSDNCKIIRIGAGSDMEFTF